MSQHPSLRSKGKGLKFRSVLKRFEKLKYLMDKEKWKEGTSVFGLPKIKQLKLKIKKEKAASEEKAEGEETTGAGKEAAGKPKSGADAKGKAAAKPGKEAKPKK